MKRPAFTLIELLIVISIVALLIGILLPALGGARDTARSAVCMSNQRQTTLALLAYANDAADQVVANLVLESGDAVWWFGREPGGPGSGANRPIDTAASPLAPYFGGDILEGLACPAFPDSDPRFYQKFAERSAHFGYNEGLAPLRQKNLPPRRVYEVKHPSGVAAFADAVHLDGLNQVGGEDAFYEPHYFYSSLAELGSPRYGGFAHARHADRANVAHVDGHVEPMALVGTVWHTVADAPAGNIEEGFGEDSIYGFNTRVLPVYP